MLVQEKKVGDLLEDKIFTFSNLLSVTRVLLLPIFFYYSDLYVKSPANVHYFLTTIGIVLAAVLTDYLDGFLARLFHQETVLGRYLDPVCDKITTIGGLGVLVKHFQFPTWIFGIYIFREILGIWLGGFLYLKRGIQGKPNWWGKIGVGIVSVAMFWYMSMPYIHTQDSPPDWLTHPDSTAYVLLVVLFFGAIGYAKRYWNIVLHPEKAKIDPQDKKQQKKYRVV